MSSRKPKASTKAGRKKLTLSTETLKDLTANRAGAKGVRGGAGGYAKPLNRGYTDDQRCSF